MTDEPTQSEIEALSRELTEAAESWMCDEGEFGCKAMRHKDLHERAALMIARLERLWLEARKPTANTLRDDPQLQHPWPWPPESLSPYKK